MTKKFVLNLIEDGAFGGQEGMPIRYLDGKVYNGEDVSFPDVLPVKQDGKVKNYTSIKRAENAVKKLKDKFTYVSRAESTQISY
jgi:hypothetical protein